MVPMIEIHAPDITHTVSAPGVTYTIEIINKPSMVYDTKENLINTSKANRVGISSMDHSTSFTIWFDDGAHKQHMGRIFSSRQEAVDFLNSLYNIKE